MTIGRNNLTRPGQPQSASLENEKRRLDTFRVIGGPGVRISQTGDIVRIDVDGVRGSSGEGQPQWVKTLPAIPTAPKTRKVVYWMSATTEEGGTGDDQFWEAATGWTAYRPLDKYTTLSGVPVA